MLMMYFPSQPQALFGLCRLRIRGQLTPLGPFLVLVGGNYFSRLLQPIHMQLTAQAV